MHALTGRTADDAWRAAASLFAAGGPAERQAGRGGSTWELLHVGLTIEDPRARWVVSRAPAMNPAFALVEVLWIAAGRQDAALPVFWNPRLPRYCGNAAVYPGAYGHRLRAHFGVDQLDRVYRALEAQPDTRQAVLQIWDAADDLPGTDGTPAREDVPCNVAAFPKLRAGRLEWMQVMRSNDLFLGFPHNVVQFTALQEMLAGWLGAAPGAYHHVADSLHVYARDLEAVRASLAGPDPGVPVGVAAGAPRASFALARPAWDAVLRDALRRLEDMTASALTPPALSAAAFAGDTPPAYEDAVRVAAADVARRHGWRDVAAACITGCADPALRALWGRWNVRNAGRLAGRRTSADVPADMPVSAPTSVSDAVLP